MLDCSFNAFLCFDDFCNQLVHHKGFISIPWFETSCRPSGNACRAASLLKFCLTPSEKHRPFHLVAAADFTSPSTVSSKSPSPDKLKYLPSCRPLLPAAPWPSSAQVEGFLVRRRGSGLLLTWRAASLDNVGAFWSVDDGWSCSTGATQAHSSSRSHTHTHTHTHT